jgi:hypothetical protein
LPLSGNTLLFIYVLRISIKSKCPQLRIYRYFHLVV